MLNAVKRGGICFHVLLFPCRQWDIREIRRDRKRAWDKNLQSVSVSGGTGAFNPDHEWHHLTCQRSHLQHEDAMTSCFWRPSPFQAFHSITSDNFGNYVTLNQNVFRAACLAELGCRHQTQWAELNWIRRSILVLSRATGMIQVCLRGNLRVKNIH